MKYEGKKTREISFPLGGIGTGCIGLGGHGGFVDVEIKNRPNKNTTAEFTHFSIKAEDEHHVLDCRILQGDLEKNYIGAPGGLCIQDMALVLTGEPWQAFPIFPISYLTVNFQQRR